MTFNKTKKIGKRVREACAEACARLIGSYMQQVVVHCSEPQYNVQRRRGLNIPKFSASVSITQF